MEGWVGGEILECPHGVEQKPALTHRCGGDAAGGPGPWHVRERDGTKRWLLFMMMMMMIEVLLIQSEAAASDGNNDDDNNDDDNNDD